MYVFYGNMLQATSIARDVVDEDSSRHLSEHKTRDVDEENTRALWSQQTKSAVSQTKVYGMRLYTHNACPCRQEIHLQGVHPSNDSTD